MKTKQLKPFIVSIAMLIFIWYFYSENSKVSPKQEKVKADKSEIKIPKYIILEDRSQGDVNKAIKIRLEKKASKSILKLIGNKIKTDIPTKFKKLRVDVYLPDMKVKEPPWAIVKFEPNLQVDILGLTIEEEKKLVKDDRKNIIGKWLATYTGSIITLYSENDKLYIEYKHNENSITKHQVLESIVALGKRLNFKEGNDEEYYILDKNGDLQLWGVEDGYFSTNRKVK